MRNELISKKHKKVCTTLNYIEQVLFLGCKITGYISISAFGSLVGISVGITSSATGLKICAITAGIKKYNSVIKKKKKKHYKIRLQGLIDSVITHDEFVSINKVLKEYNKVKE